MFALPFILFMIFMVLIPLGLLFYHAFSHYGEFTFDNFTRMFNDGYSLRVLWQSIWIALVVTITTLLIAYPIAYGLNMAGFKRKTTILILFTVPLWTNLLLRSIALRNVFSLINIEPGLGALLFALVFNFLPITILPIYIVLSNIDKRYIEASRDLGASPLRVFFKTVLPLSTPGIVASIILVFTPVVSTFFISAFFGGNNYMFGELLASFFPEEFGGGAARSVILLAMLVFTVIILNKSSKVGNKRGGLW